MSKKILIIDNYDSFTFNLFQMVKEITCDLPTVLRNDRFELETLESYDAIILSPGPGLPSEAGLMPDVLRIYGSRKPILGICLGHQAIGEHFGGTLENLAKVCHGLALETIVQVPDDPLFEGVALNFPSGRYHSWVVAPDSLPDELEITSTDAEGRIMSLRHRTFNLTGLQFHPESVLTPDGHRIVSNWFANL